MAAFKDKTQAELDEEFQKWQEKRMKKSIESPAKRTAQKNIINANKDEFEEYRKEGETKATRKEYTQAEIQEKVEKYIAKLKKGTKAPSKRYATKKLLEAHKPEYQAELESQLALVRGQKPAGQTKSKKS